MNDLLHMAMEAHGGLRRWNQVKAIKVAASITGAIWFVKGKGDFLKDVVLTVDTRAESVTLDFPGQDKRAIFVPSRIVIEKTDGAPIDSREDPEKSFVGSSGRRLGTISRSSTSSRRLCGPISTRRSFTPTKVSSPRKSRQFKSRARFGGG